MPQLETYENLEERVHRLREEMQRRPADEALREFCAAVARRFLKPGQESEPGDWRRFWLEREVVLAGLLIHRGQTENAIKLLTDLGKSLAEGREMKWNLTLSLRPEDDAERRMLGMVAFTAFEPAGTLHRKDGLPGAIDSMKRHLKLSYDDLGRMFGVSGETARRWASGRVRIPESQAAKIEEAHDSLLRLLRLIKPERLATVVRRPAEAFGGRRALDLIIEGRIREVADTYDALLTYSG
jgi:DNA-binding transcriptional regulator YiaG